MDRNTGRMKSPFASPVKVLTRTQRRRRQRQNQKLRASDAWASTDLSQSTLFLPSDEDQQVEREVRKRERRRKRRVRARRVREYELLSTSSDSVAAKEFVRVEPKTYPYKEERPFFTPDGSTNCPREHDELLYLMQGKEEKHLWVNDLEPSVKLWNHHIHGDNRRDYKKFNYITCSALEEQQRRMLLEEVQEQQVIRATHKFQGYNLGINKHVE